MLKLQAATRLHDILKPEQNSFGVVRMMLALAVLISHAYFLVTGQTSAEPLSTLTGHSLGEHAVEVFFLLSGVLVTQSLTRSGSVIDFATGRVLRIFPGLIVCVLLTALVLGPLVSTRPPLAYASDPGAALYILKTALLTTGSAQLPGVFETAPAAGLVNLSLWTLKFEVLCYIGLSFLGLAGLLKARARLLLAAVLALGLSVLFLRSPLSGADYSSLDNVRYFALYFGVGVLACLLKRHVVISWPVTLTLFVAYLALLSTPLGELACALFLGSAALLAASSRFGRLRQICNRYDLSFGTYIYGAPILQTLLQLAPGLGALVLSALALPVVLLLAGLSWTFIERPAIGSKRTVGRTVAAAIDNLGLGHALARAKTNP